MTKQKYYLMIKQFNPCPTEPEYIQFGKQCVFGSAGF